jgi:hypothetical protein
VQFAPVRVGGTPAGEAVTRGPQQQAHMLAALDAPAEAATKVDMRTELQAEREQAMYEDEANKAIDRAHAIETTALRRQGEMERAGNDYEESVAKLGTMKLDNDRLWANKTTGDKIGTILLVALGGFASGISGGKNLAYEGLMKSIDQDIEAQKFDYQVAGDQVKGQQTAYGLMMDRYRSDEVATAAARTAALDYAASKANAMKAQWAGTAAANTADDLLGKIEEARQNTHASGLRYVQATQGSVRYAASVRGNVLPGTMSEKEAQERALKYGVDPTIANEHEVAKGAVQVQVEGAKGRAAASEKGEKQLNEETQKIASALQQAGVPQARSLASQALAKLNKDAGSRKEAVVRGVLGAGPDSPVFSEDSNAREQSYANFENAAIKALMGNATKDEVDRARAGLGSAKDPESRRRAIASTLEMLAEVERGVKAGASPEAQAEYDRRRKAAESPGSFKGVTSFVPDKK